MPEALFDLISLLQANLMLYIPAVFIAKISGIVLPIIPGGLFTITAIPVVGWKMAYLIDLSGSLVASNIAYTLSAKYGESLISKLFGQRILEKVQKIKVRTSRSVETAFVLRLAGSGLAADAIIWSAPLLKVPRVQFLIGYHLAHIITMLPIFYLTGQALSFNQAYIAIPTLILSMILLFIFRKSFFE